MVKKYPLRFMLYKMKCVCPKQLTVSLLLYKIISSFGQSTQIHWLFELVFHPFDQSPERFIDAISYLLATCLIAGARRLGCAKIDNSSLHHDVTIFLWFHEVFFKEDHSKVRTLHHDSKVQQGWTKPPQDSQSNVTFWFFK